MVTMLSLQKCKKDAEREDLRFSKTIIGRTTLLTKCLVCDSEKSKYVKAQKANGLSSNLGIKTPLNETPLPENIPL